MRTTIALVTGTMLFATPVLAQDFLGAFARRAAEAAASRLVERALIPQPSSPEAPATPDRAAAVAASRGAVEPNEHADLDGLPEEQRRVVCDRRVPLDPEGGRTYEKQEAFARCMGPRFGEGG